MSHWVETALQLLKDSLVPVPKELNEMDWKSKLSDKSERLAKHISAFASKIISDTIDAGLIKQTNPDNKSKKYISYVPFWA